MRPRIHRNPSFVKTFAFTLVLAVSVTSAVLAIDGVLSNGGRASGKSAFSTLKKDLKMSLHSGFQFQDNRNMGTLKSNGRYDQMHSVMSLQKGNVTLNLPMKTKSLTHRFRTPTAPSVR